MDTRQHDHLQRHYAPRAADYLTSPTHAAGADLDQIADAIAALRPARLLDLGCGGGHVAYRAAAAGAGEVIACDLTAAMLAVVDQQARVRGLTNLRTERAAAERLPFADGAFAMVVSRFSAHHWSDLDAGLREARRVLAAGGVAILADTIAPACPLLDSHMQTLELLRDPSHVRNYSLMEWTAALGRADLRLTGVTVRRLRLDVAGWTARTRTPAAQIAALRAVQAAAPAPVRTHFEFEPDGTWTIDKALLNATT